MEIVIKSLALRTLIFFLVTSNCNAVEDEHTETLLIKPLKDGMVYTFFEFKTIVHQDIENLVFGKLC